MGHQNTNNHIKVWFRPGKKRCLLFHAERLVRDTGTTRYYACRRYGRRRIASRDRTREAIDYHWLLTGEWGDANPTPTAY